MIPQLSLDLPLSPVEPALGFGHAIFGSASTPLRRAFEAMRIAEEELDRVFASRAEQPDGIFTALVLPDVMRHMTPEVYRAHARELVARARDGEDLALATRAEVLAGLYEASTVAPLNAQANAVYVRLFAAVLPDLFARLPDEARMVPAERWEGQVEEDVRAAQRAGRDESRRLPRARRRSR